MMGMQVVCTNLNLREWDREYFGPIMSYITINRSYRVRNVSDDSNPWKNKPDDVNMIDVWIKDDRGIDVWFPFYLFEPAEHVREEKLKELGIYD